MRLFLAATIYDFNTVNGIPSSIIGEEEVDLIVTSPPYGDSRTTVAYGQFSRLASQWLDYENALMVDKELMGGNHRIPNWASTEARPYFESKVLNDTIENISVKDAKRARDVISFYYDYEHSIRNVAKVVKKMGHVCYVVGNRHVKGIKIPNDEITKNLFEENGFEHIQTVIRNIPNKRMPSKNSPTNEAGKLGSTMTQEYIVILRKADCER